jgi:hypothetical protein
MLTLRQELHTLANPAQDLAEILANKLVLLDKLELQK